MRHGISGRKFGRNHGSRKALFKNLACSLIHHEQIKTTLPKAKEIRPIVERLITLGKVGTLAARRRIVATLGSEDAQKKLVDTLRLRYEKRPGGYTRIVKAGFRAGDCAPMAIIELVDRELEVKAEEVTQVAEPVSSSEDQAKA